ncbi:MAG TPA: M20/M25/M40 family metallo-hydrolase [Chitinophagaceae bacterium]|jgi:acetylornithine deacetylase/succinyl-diaminopimelate desuccinylase-like protein|nr:M20/M25/M40 family metallo-hydrolase [Chitinophagaceae bacterium]
MRCVTLAISLLIFTITFGQTPDLEKIHSYRQKNEASVYNDFISFLKIPNVATDTLNIRKNADFLSRLMNEKGISNVQLLEANDKNVPPVVYGEIKVHGAAKTVIFYAHYDGQPVNPSLWAKGLHPFQPQLVDGRIDENAAIQTSLNFPLNNEWRIYARGASDDKGGVMAILTAFTAIKESGIKFPYNIKFFFEGEEEQGSNHLQQILEKYKSLFQSDIWIICDGPVHQSGYKQVVFGARGDAHLTLKVYGPKNPLHSGHYGNWVPNPVMILSKLLASMKDDNGMVAVKGFYDDVIPLSSTEKQALTNIPEVDKDLKKKIGFAKEEMTGKKLIEIVNLPSLNINGIESSNVGTIQANVIPTSATAVIDLRLVLGNDWKRQQQKVIDHIIKQGFYVTENEPTDEERSKYEKIVQIKKGMGNNAQRTSMDWPIAKSVVAAIQQTTKDPVLKVPTLGGSLPVEDLVKVLNAKFLIVPIANPDNNQHAENENIRIKNFWDGIDMMAATMLMKF